MSVRGFYCFIVFLSGLLGAVASLCFGGFLLSWAGVVEEYGLEIRARYLVLLLLAEGPKTGYELMKRTGEVFRGAGGRSLSPGTLYPLLQSMEAEGLVVAFEEPRGLRRRRVYRLTRKGVEVLLAMIARGLGILEAGFEVHLEALRGLVGGLEVDVVVRELVLEIASRLKSVEVLVSRLRELFEEVSEARASISRGRTLQRSRG
ncbi:MAG: hypothetical protein DSY37_00455 [Hyperthermus sp.]|nr:MAG: hypothetical protein DSY37_00455 [Hyperthermus sp.]